MHQGWHHNLRLLQRPLLVNLFRRCKIRIYLLRYSHPQTKPSRKKPPRPGKLLRSRYLRPLYQLPQNNLALLCHRKLHWHLLSHSNEPALRLLTVRPRKGKKPLQPDNSRIRSRRKRRSRAAVETIILRGNQLHDSKPADLAVG
jgi:hypothetical protein